jgi:TolA-binding protein
MYRYVMLAVLWIASANVFSQDAAFIAAQREAEERERRMSALVESLQQANSVQQRRINELNNDIAALRRQFVELENRFKNSQLGAVTQTDLRKAYDKMAEIEKNRQADNNLVKEQFVELKKLMEKPIVVPAAPINPTPRDTKPPKDNVQEPEQPDFTGEYFTYKIKNGDRLMQVIAAFNSEIKSQGKNKASITLDMVKKANPKLNPNNLPVGREIKIPVPPDK